MHWLTSPPNWMGRAISRSSINCTVWNQSQFQPQSISHPSCLSPFLGSALLWDSFSRSSLHVMANTTAFIFYTSCPLSPAEVLKILPTGLTFIMWLDQCHPSARSLVQSCWLGLVLVPFCEIKGEDQLSRAVGVWDFTLLQVNRWGGSHSFTHAAGLLG